MNAESIIKPKRPNGAGWTQFPPPPRWYNHGYPAELWRHESGIACVSAVEVTYDQGQSDGPHYHLSMSRPGRVPRQEALWVLRQFALEGAEEDNHVPGGFVRNFWRPVAENRIGLECSCKADEPVIREDKGDFEWRGITE